MDGIKTLYTVLRTDKRKERFEMILEPMQAVIQLAILSFCPQGSKLSISSNLLQLQIPNWTQFIQRTYNHDRRDDLVYLFSVITRFYKFYSYLNDGDENSKLLFKLVIELGLKGLDKLTQTYAGCGDGALLQTLKMYYSMLERGESLCWDRLPANETHSNGVQKMNDDIDEILIQIREIYTSDHYIIFLHTLSLMKANPDEYESYKKCLDGVMIPTNNKIQEWIQKNIAY